MSKGQGSSSSLTAMLSGVDRSRRRVGDDATGGEGAIRRANTHRQHQGRMSYHQWMYQVRI